MIDQNDVIPTHSLSHEMSTISSMMVGPEYVEQAWLLGLKPEHFYRPSHRAFCKAMYDLRAKGKPPEMPFIIEIMGDSLKHHGGEEYLIQVGEWIPSASSLEFYAREVIAHWARNEITKIGRMAQDPETSMEQMRVRMEAAFQGLVAPGSRVVSRLSPARDMPRKRGVQTYIREIDRSTSVYGLPVGQFALVAAYTKAGKTALMRQVAVNVARNGGRVLYGLFADLTKVEFEGLVMRNLTGFGHTPDSADGFEALQEWDRCVEEVGRDWDFDVYDPQDINIEEAGHIETFAAYALREHSRRPYDLVCIDYAQELTTKDVRGGNSFEIGNVCSRKVRALARRLETATTMVASQITEGGEGKRDTTKGSRTWEERAGYVLRLKRDEKEPDVVSFTVPFQRFGKSGLKWSMDFNTSYLDYRTIGG